jgi:peptide deformylase
LVLPIRLYPDPVLRQPAADVTSFDDELRQLAENMTETMYAAPGVGLAAPQVGVSLRLALVDVSVGKESGKLKVLVNPRIVERVGSSLESEACLSIPDFSEKVERPERVRVSFQDLDGVVLEVVVEGFEARAFCHEIDHLAGTLFVDHLRGLRRDRAKRFLRRFQ